MTAQPMMDDINSNVTIVKHAFLMYFLPPFIQLRKWTKPFKGILSEP
jgi:hypothetical protein